MFVHRRERNVEEEEEEDGNDGEYCDTDRLLNRLK